MTVIGTSVSAKQQVSERIAGASDYVAALDGVRAVSILIVMLSHGGLGSFVPGGLGVTIFFVVSGYLINRQLISETERIGRVRLQDFYLRRVFRLVPALLVYLAISIPLAIALGAVISWVQAASGVFYFSNYLFIYNVPAMRNPVSILWSLSIEEHYYLVFPLAVVLFRRCLRGLMLPVCVAVALGLVWRIVLAHACGPSDGVSAGLCGVPWTPGAPENRRIYYGTDTRFDSILVGALLALLAHYRPGTLRRLLHPAALWSAAALLLATLLIREAMFRDTLRYTLQNFAIAVLLAGVVFGSQGWAARLLSSRPAVYVGRLSYSLYLYHWGLLMVIALLGRTVRPNRIEFPVFLVASFALAALSYHLVEQPMLQVRRRFGSHA